MQVSREEEAAAVVATHGERAGGAVHTVGLTMRFPRDVVALEDVSIDISHGEFVTVVGPSGCGKSTLLRILAGLQTPTDGVATVFGAPIGRPRADVSVMFQVPTLLDWRNSLENVILPFQLGDRRGTRRIADVEREAMELLDMLGLAGFEHTYPPHLSGGMQQRVALARSLICGSRFLLLDEPFGSLDEFTRERLNIELMDVCERFSLTVLLVTHNISEAVLLADRVFVMTPSPGRLAGVLSVDLPRPRDIELTGTHEFNELVFQGRELLAAHITRSSRRPARDPEGDH